MTFQGDLDATVQIPTMVATTVTVQCDIPILILKNLTIADPAPDPVIIMMNAEMSSLIGSEAPSMVNIHVLRIPDSEVLSTSGFTLTALHRVHILALFIADDAEARNARLAAMASNVTTMSADRQQRLAALLEKEGAELKADEQARAKSKGMSGFLSQEQKRVFGGVGGL
jgi:hypothetical protein